MEAEANGHLEHVVQQYDVFDEIPPVPELGIGRQHQPRQHVGEVRGAGSLPRADADAARPALVLALHLADLLLHFGQHGHELGERHEVTDVRLVQELEHAVREPQLLLLPQHVAKSDGHQLRHLRGSDALPVVVELPEALRDAPLVPVLDALAPQESGHAPGPAEDRPRPLLRHGDLPRPVRQDVVRLADPCVQVPDRAVVVVHDRHETAAPGIDAALAGSALRHVRLHLGRLLD
mmetsp:Transcript_28709/g.86820  ORF Transcript_28709/g.86820 Transcript_28709/m.86820 type:complete len:235 (+) Transcript_28709:1704-2408(+)